MKDLVLLILKQIPKYFSNFISILGGPKTFIRQHNDDKQETITEAMIFLGISIVIAMIIMWPLVPAQIESARFLATRSLLYLILTALGAGLALASWKLVGGNASFGKYFVINCYYGGVVIVCMMLILTCALGVVILLDPELYPMLAESSILLRNTLNEKLAALINDPNNKTHLMVWALFYLIYFFGASLLGLWSIIGWGAYREINGLSKGRSFVAGVVYAFLMILLLSIPLLIQAAFDRVQQAT